METAKILKNDVSISVVSTVISNKLVSIMNKLDKIDDDFTNGKITLSQARTREKILNTAIRAGTNAHFVKNHMILLPPESE